MPRRPAAVLALSLAVGLSGCSDQGPPPGLAEEIALNRTVWQATRPQAYSYTILHQCFCGVEARGPVEVEVSGPTVVRRVYVDTGAEVDAQFAPSFPSVDGLFDILESAVDTEADEIKVVWDSTNGIPLNFSIDYDRETADEEQGYEVVAIPTPR